MKNDYGGNRAAHRQVTQGLLTVDPRSGVFDPALKGEFPIFSAIVARADLIACQYPFRT